MFAYIRTKNKTETFIYYKVQYIIVEVKQNHFKIHRRELLWYVFDSTYSIKNFKGNVIIITYKPYMEQNDFEIICSSRVFDIIMEKIKNI